MSNSSTGRNPLIDKQTLFRLSSAVNDSHFRLQVACTKLSAMLDVPVVPDELFAEVGAAIAQLRAALSKLEVFLLTLGERV